MSSVKFINQKSLFKAYDIRGRRHCFTPNFTLALSDALAYYFVENSTCKTVVIGYDTRHASQQIAETLAHSFNNLEVNVIWLGLVTTPIMAYWANKFEGHGLIATASHSEPDYNGIKWLLNGESPSSEDIQKIYKLTSNNATNSLTEKTSSSYSRFNFLDDHRVFFESSFVSDSYYKASADALTWINTLQSRHSLEVTPTQSPNSFKIVIDCLNGATSPFAESFFKQHRNLCSEIIMLNDTPNGDFPKGNPDPMEENRLEELCDAVLFHKADLGFSFDGDGDRLMVVDHNGKPLTPDHLLYILARVAIEDYDAKQSNVNAIDRVASTSNLEAVSSKKDTNNKLTTFNLTNNNLSVSTVTNSTVTNGNNFEIVSNNSNIVSNNPNSDITPIVIFDVKCSHHLPVLIQQIGANGQMSKTGSSIFRRALQANKYGSKERVLFAGELSGHYIFNDGYFLLHDDAMYAALRLLNWLYYQPINSETHARTTIADIVNSLPSMVSTTDVYLPVDSYTLNEFNCIDKVMSVDIKNNTLNFNNLQRDSLIINHANSESQNYQLIFDKSQTKFSPNKKYNFNAEGCQGDSECIEDTDSIRQTILDQMTKLCQNLLNSSSDPNKCCGDLDVDLPLTVNMDQDNDARTKHQNHPFKLSFIDGLRLDFEHGFGIIRSSRTSNKLTIRFAGDTLSDLQQVQKFFVNICQSINQDFANQVANIQINQYN